jgi:hypothetical protein
MYFYKIKCHFKINFCKKKSYFFSNFVGKNFHYTQKILHIFIGKKKKIRNFGIFSAYFWQFFSLFWQFFFIKKSKKWKNTFFKMKKWEVLIKNFSSIWKNFWKKKVKNELCRFLGPKIFRNFGQFLSAKKIIIRNISGNFAVNLNIETRARYDRS